MPTQPERNRPNSRADRRRKRRRAKLTPTGYLLLGASIFFLVALLALLLTRCAVPKTGGEIIPTPTPTPTQSVETPAPTPVPTPALTPPPVPVEPYDFTQPVAEGDEVGDDYFKDAVFVGDSRTSGLKLFGGIPETTFLDYNGIMVFEVDNPDKGVRIDGKKHSFLEALGLKQYGKVYLMLGVNELGYFDDAAFQKEYAGFVDKIKELQPDAIIYLQNLPAINPDKAKANNQPYYITNEQIDIYNAIIAEIAAEKHVALVDVDTGLTDENGILARENSTDGVHFSKEHYKNWYAYLKTHTVDETLYRDGQ